MDKISAEDLEIIRPVIEAIKTKKDYNWPTSEYCREEEDPHTLYVDSGLITEEQYEIFDEFVPHGEFGIHTIASITLFEVVGVKDLL